MYMKNTRWLGLVAAAAFPLLSSYGQAPVAQVPNGPEQTQTGGSVPTDISPGVAEVVKLAESGVAEDVVLAFIQSSKSTYNLSANHILYLKDLGLSAPVMTAMLSHDTALGGQPQPFAPVPQFPVAPAAPEPAALPPTYVSNPPDEVNYFYNDLSPYGSWVVLDGIGWCWQPRAVVINRGWQPYCDGGHWLNSDAGWYWASDYSWGWAPFHYGRWQLHERSGWVWTPDRVWAPAWVTWRVAGDNCGWAPLPPHATFDARLGWRFNGVSVGAGFDFGLRSDHFTFVALNNFSDRDLGRRRLPATEVRNIYKQTTIINNYTVNNTTIVNHGIPVERVAAATHTEIRKATIRDLPAGSDKALRTQGAAKSGLVVYRPQLAAPSRLANVVAQKVDEQHPVVRHAPIAPMQVQRKSPPSGNGPAPVTAPRRTQPDNSNAPQRSKGDKSSSSFQQDPPAPRISQPAPTAPSSPTPTRPTEDQTQATRAISADRSDAVAPLEASRTPVQGSRNTGQKDYQGQSPHLYYPKGYYQSSEIRSRSQSNPRQDTPSSRAEKDKGRSN
jgi:hypothetical protein